MSASRDHPNILYGAGAQSLHRRRGTMDTASDAAARKPNPLLCSRTLGGHMQSDLSHGSSDPQTLARRLRALRVRVTPQRLLVLEALATHGGHMTAEEVM